MVIEGAACSGKTKLAALVHEGARAMELKSQIHHLEEPFSAKACIKKLTTGLPDGEVAILDGFHFSAAAALRRRPFTFRDDVLAIERLLSSMQAIKVELTASESVFERRLIDAAPDARRRFERCTRASGRSPRGRSTCTYTRQPAHTGGVFVACARCGS